MNFRRIAILLLFAGVILFAGFLFGGRNKAGSARPSPPVSPASPAAGTPVAKPDLSQNPEETPGKFREREVITRLSNDEVLSFLTDALSEPVGFPAQTLEERTTAINNLLRKQVPPADRIRVSIFKRTEDAGAGDRKLPALDPQERLSDIMRKSAHAASVHYRVFEGRLEFILPG